MIVTDTLLSAIHTYLSAQSEITNNFKTIIIDAFGKEYYENAKPLLNIYPLPEVEIADYQVSTKNEVSVAIEVVVDNDPQLPLSAFSLARMVDTLLKTNYTNANGYTHGRFDISGAIAILLTKSREITPKTLDVIKTLTTPYTYEYRQNKT